MPPRISRMDLPGTGATFSTLPAFLRKEKLSVIRVGRTRIRRGPGLGLRRRSWRLPVVCLPHWRLPLRRRHEQRGRGRCPQWRGSAVSVRAARREPSAVTVFFGTARAIVNNDANLPPRQASSLRETAEHAAHHVRCSGVLLIDDAGGELDPRVFWDGNRMGTRVPWTSDPFPSPPIPLDPG